jgi:spermidine synthase
VVEAIPNVIDWHRRGLVPLGRQLADDPRCTLHHGDFFALARDSFRALDNARRYHAVLLDIDHSPSHVLHPENQGFYSVDGLLRLRSCLHENGVFALWSNDPPEHAFIKVLDEVFRSYTVEIIDIENPITGLTSHNSVYVAHT